MGWKVIGRWLRVGSGALVLALSAWWMVSLLPQFSLNELSGAASPLTGRTAVEVPIVNMAAAAPALTGATAAPTSAPLAPAVATPTAAPLSPDLQAFIQQVADGDASQVRGVFVPDLLALPIVQQPAADPAFVSSAPNVATQFSSAIAYGVTGLLAHNYLAGELFYQLTTGQQVMLVYGDGAVRRFQIAASFAFQKLNPNSTHSDMIDLATGNHLSTTQVFNRFYRGDGQVTFQTCLERDGLANWGLTFIVANPID